ncbi:hypothetical protein KAJ87_00340 [Candidatus Pacearchaeota archaeon]|nr:hypothetical protein [Candidatus Pacearchaeota archaeon]
MLLQGKSKKGVSIMIGYVLLIVFAIIISFVVYRSLKTYIPKDVIECPEGVSIFIEQADFNSVTSILNLSLINNGKFNIAGYFIYARNISDEEVLATISLAEYTPKGKDKGGYVLLHMDNSLKPNEKINNLFDLSATGIGEIYSIEIIPTRFQEEENKIRFVSCGDAKVSETIS